MANTTDRHREFAVMGAALRLGQIADEMRMIVDLCPELRSQNGLAPLLRMPGVSAVVQNLSVQDPPAASRSHKRKLTAGERRHISDRMKEYWARRKAKQAGPK